VRAAGGARGGVVWPPEAHPRSPPFAPLPSGPGFERLAGLVLHSPVRVAVAEPPLAPAVSRAGSAPP
jgi:hypothetical protein